ncbi:ABC transporter ATP-binding protein [Paucisalibacillus globulus]|uniref:ABC transporter ATP-binding protein n=1 Tax=Paucisalibacillus globulus TaxID=351095 RepID=UPI000405D9E5|nr:ABC transporter ATP-binding protein [Paucisalibacillus globulus]
MAKYFLKHKILLSTSILFKLVFSLMQVYIAIVLQELTDYIVNQDMEGFKSYLIMASLYFSTFGIVVYLNHVTIAYFIKRTIADYKNDVFNGILSKDYENYYVLNNGEYISNLTNDINIIESNYMMSILQLIGDVAIFILTVIVLLYINPYVTITLLVSGILLFLIPTIFGKPLRKRQNMVSEKFSNYTSLLKNLLSGFSTIKSYNLESKSYREFEEINTTLEDVKLKSLRLQSIFYGVSMTLGILTLVIGIIISGYFVIIGTLTAGSLVAVIHLSNNVTNPIQSIVARITQIKSSKEINKKLSKLMANTNGDDIELEEYESEKCLQTAIAYHNVSFSYDGKRDTISDFSYQFKKGRKYAIVGKSGSGKSTLFKLLVGFLKKYSGSIHVDKKEIKGLDSSLVCRDIAMVEQDVFMFNKSIKENIILDHPFDEKHFHYVLKVTGLDGVICGFQQGVETILQEESKNISGGQKQRIGIARALYQRKNVLLLDEGASALDSESSLRLQEDLLTNKELTIISITHGLNERLLSYYDEILVIEDGRLIESGDFHSLILRKSYFYELFTKDKETVSFNNLTINLGGA